MAGPRKPLSYTFGNHMHWVDMEWLWGGGVLPGSVADMLRLCHEAGVVGNVNFDGVGYERMAAQHPAALEALREAVAAGTVEVVGGSYGQPYGLFLGGESNVRQRVLGVRVAERLLGVRPRSFWEEEFDFFPQLPQLLRGCGYEAACLFFQWTWHTPELPREQVSLVEWEGVDGSTLPALPRNGLCLHQWPEDFAQVLEEAAATEAVAPALVQWLELMPSPDWMCRSEVLLPELQRLREDPRFELRPRTLGPLVAELREAHAAAGAAPPQRRYPLDATWHGMSLGKNGDAVPRASRAAEEALLGAEAAAAWAGLLGRPYPSWDVYPAWELEEGWRELLAAQHHDNHECEGLCGSIGHEQFRRARALADGVRGRTLRHLGWRADGRLVVANRLGWERDVVLERGGGRWVVPAVPGFGMRVVDPADGLRPLPTPADLGSLVHAACGADGLRLRADTVEGPLEQLPEGRRAAWLEAEPAPLHGAVRLRPRFDPSAGVELRPGLNGGLRLVVEPAFEVGEVWSDSPFAVERREPGGRWPRKYPTGDWMTSPQWFEEVEAPFTGLHFAELRAADGSGGLLVAHDGSQQFFRTGRGVELQLLTRDPWDQSEARMELDASVWLLRHGQLAPAALFRLARELAEPAEDGDREARGHMTDGPAPTAGLPAALPGPVVLDAPGVVPSALYRDPAVALPGCGPDAGPPFVLRLVETDGRPAEARVLLPGRVLAAVRTDLLGERAAELAVCSAAPPPDGDGLAAAWSELRVGFRPHEIVTLAFDLELGRKQLRDLDAKREVWATVHRREDAGEGRP